MSEKQGIVAAEGFLKLVEREAERSGDTSRRLHTRRTRGITRW